METDLQAVPDGFPAIELVLALVGGRVGQAPLALGSAVFVAPGVALTASHVIEEYWRQFDDAGRWRSGGAATFAMQAVQYLPHHRKFVTWHATLASHRDLLDIALLQLTPEDGELPASYVWPYPTLDLHPVARGTGVQAFGFAQADVYSDSKTGGWVLGHAAGGSVGIVTEVFDEGRDRAKKPFPCFEMNIEIRGGMSGGPVVNEEGNICGLVTSSWTFTEPGPHLSAASLLRPALDLRLVGTGNLSAEGQALTLRDLMGLGHLNAVGLGD